MKDAASPDRFQGVNGQHYEKGLADVVQTEAVGADQGLGLIPPNRATNGQKAGLQGGKDLVPNLQVSQNPETLFALLEMEMVDFLPAGGGRTGPAGCEDGPC